MHIISAFPECQASPGGFVFTEKFRQFAQKNSNVFVLTEVGFQSYDMIDLLEILGGFQKVQQLRQREEHAFWRKQKGGFIRFPRM